MKINFDTILTTLDNKPIKSGGTCSECGHTREPEDLTLEKVSIIALFSTGPKVEANEKLERYVLAQRIKKHPIVELSAEDIVLIRKEIANVYGPLAYGRASEVLDPGAVKKLEVSEDPELIPETADSKEE